MGATEDWLASIGATTGAKTALVLSADPRSPDELAGHAKIGAQLGLPPIVIGSDPEAFKARAAEKSIADAVTDAPKTAAWLQNRDNGGIAKDDVANLSWFEKGLKDWEASGDTGVSRAIVRGTKSLAGSMQGFGAIQSAITAADIGLTKEQIIAREVAALGPNPDVSMVAAAQQAALIKYDAVSGMTEEEKAAMLQGASGRLQIARDTLAKAAAIPRSGIAQEGADTWAAAPNTLMGKLGTIAQNPAAVLAFLGETAAESLPALIPATVATLATRSPVVGAGVMGATSGYLTASTEAMGFLESRGIKMETPDDVLAVLSNQELMLEARQYGLDKGLIVGALDTLSGGVAGKTLMKSPVGDAIAQSVTQALFGGGGEALAQLAVDGQLDWGAVLIEGLAEFVTAPAEMVSVGRGWLKSSAEKAARAGTTAGKIEAIDKMAAESKVKARSPEKMADLLDRVMDGKSLYVPADDLNELFQAKEFGPADWGIDPATFEEMLASGGDVAIPAATYASKITGTENADWFKQNAKTSVGEMSAVEATRFNEEVRGIIEELMAQADADRQSMQELRASDVQVKDQLYTMLREAGHTKDVADTNARVVAAAIRTMAQRSGQDPLDMAKRFGLEVKGPQTNEMRRRGNLDIALNTLRKGAVQKPGASLMDFVIGNGGLQDTGGDLAAMDAPKGVIAETRDEVMARTSQPSLQGQPAIGKGKGLDDMARAAIEAGYFPDLQSKPEDNLANVLMDALRAEMAGQKRFIPGQEGNADLQGLAAELDRRGIDLALSNDEIAAALAQDADGKTLFQEGYRGMHTAPMNEDGNASLADIVQVFGDDILGKNALRYFGTGNDAMDRATIKIIQDAAKNPGKPITIYRAVPAGTDAINAGDWVTVNRAYAESHANYSDDPTEIIEMQVFPTEVFSDGNSIHEFGYDPSGKDARRTYNQPAYHGTPHLFDKFMTDRIGSGTGEKAFGWGLYFAGRKEIAKHYRDNLSGMQKSKVELALAKHGGDVDAAIAGVNAEIDRLAALSLDAGSKAMQARKIAAQQETLQALDNFKKSGNNEGRLFKVDIPEDSDLLNWEVSLAKQPRNVREKMAALVSEVAAATKNDGDRKDIEKGKATGELFYRRLSQYLATKNQTGTVSDDAAASLALKDVGIPGHRLFDGPSANAGFMERKQFNYVIYDENAVNVLEYDQQNRASIVFPSGGIDGRQTVISMFENSDLSSFQHEIGHYMLEVFNVLAGEDSAPQDMRDDMAAIQKYLGMEPGAKPTVEQHELFARTWEAYLMEGKSPTLELADAFARFKAWMVRIYQTVAGLKVKINPEIRAVMDRMIATDEEIRAARAEQAMKPLFTDETAAGMTPGAFKTYQRMARRATEQAEQSLLEKTMAVERRKMEAWWKAEYKQVLDQVTKFINSQRPYRLTEMLANQVWLSDTPKTVPDMQIDRKQLVDMFGAGVLAELSREKLGGKRAIYKDGGASPMEVADLFGFANPQEMVDILQNAGKRKDAIRAETDRIMRDRYGDPLTDGSIESAALEAIHSEQQAMTVASEVRHLAVRAGVSTRNLTAQVFRQRARLMLGRMTVSEAGNPNAFLAAGRKAAKRAEDAFARVAGGKDSQDALMAATRHKEQQLLNHYLYLESRDFARELDSGREKMRGYTKASVRAKLEGGYIEQIDTLLDAYDFRVQSKKQVARAESLTAFVQRMTDAGRAGELAIDQRVIDRAKKVHYSRLSVDELRGLFDTIANIDHLGRFKQKLIDAAEQRDHDAVVDGVLAEFDANVKPNPPSRTPDAGERAAKKGRDYLNSVLNADTLLREIDGFKDLGPTWTAMKAKIDQGMFRLTERRKAMGEAFDKIYSAYSLAEKRDMSAKKQNAALGIPMSKWDLIALALNTGNNDNFERLTNPKSPGHFDAAGIQSALTELTERDWATVQATWDYINSFWPEIAAKEKRQTGVAPKKVEAKLMVNAPAGVTGGYYPIRYDGRLSGLTQDFSQKEMADSLMGGMFGKAQTRNGHTEARVSTTKQPILLDLAVGHQHVEQVLYDLEIGEAVAGSWKVLHDGRIRSAFINAGKQSDWDALEIWQQDVASGDRAAAGGVQSMMRMLRTGFTFSRLAFNLSTALIQPSGLVQSAVVIGKEAVAKGTISYMQNPARWVRDVTEVSSLMRERKMTFERDINNAVGDLALSQDGTSWVSKSANWVSPVLGNAVVGTSMRWQKFQRDVLMPASFWMMQSVQFYAVDMPTWVSAYQKELATSGDEAKARTYADTITKRAQGSGLISDRGMLERGTLNRNSRQQELPKLLTALGSYMFAKGNVAYEQAMKTDFKNPVQVMSFAVDIALLFTLEAVLYAAVKGGLPGDDEEPADWAAWLAKQTLFSAMSTLPGFRELSGAMQGYGGGGVLGSSIEVMARPFIQAGQGDYDKSAVKAFTDAAGITLHLPSAQIKNIIENMFEADMSVKASPDFGGMAMGGKGRTLADMLFGD